MHNFIARHAKKVIGCLSGFDRLVFRGTFRKFSFAEGIKSVLTQQGVLFKEFEGFAKHITQMIRDDCDRLARTHDLPTRFIESSHVRKENVAREFLAQAPERRGPICVLSASEPCRTWEMWRSKKAQTQIPKTRSTKCLHLYVYFVDDELGFGHVRIQTWMPYTIQICINGREWLARHLDVEGMGYQRADNTFLAFDDIDRAQEIFNGMVTTHWPQVLDRISTQMNPMLQVLGDTLGSGPYWTVRQAEWATDVMFRKAEDLAALYPHLVRHAISTFDSEFVMRFLGRKLSPNFKGEVLSDFKKRLEGICVHHGAAGNWLKMYDKALRILRIEMTAHVLEKLLCWAGRGADKPYRPLRKTVVDLPRLAEVCQAANNRYLDALAVVDEEKTVKQILSDVLRPAHLDGRRVRPLRPWSEPDLSLLRAINHGKFAIQGFRNRDLLPMLHTGNFTSEQERKREAAKITRLLRILRAHAVIRKVEGTHRYQITSKGRRILAAVLMTSDASLTKLKQCA